MAFDEAAALGHDAESGGKIEDPGGTEGGELVFAGTPEDLAGCERSFAGQKAELGPRNTALLLERHPNPLADNLGEAVHLGQPLAEQVQDAVGRERAVFLDDPLGHRNNVVWKDAVHKRAPGQIQIGRAHV